jgi:hypothetical protein
MKKTSLFLLIINLFICCQKSFNPLISNGIYYEVTGIITSKDKPLEGVKIECSDGTSYITDSTGKYILKIKEYSSLNINISKIGYIFEPNEISLTNITSDYIQNFTGQYIVFNFLPMNVGNMWKYKVDYFQGDSFNEEYQGEEEWNIISISEDYSNFQLKCIFNGIRISRTIIQSETDTTIINNHETTLNIKILNNALDKISCIKNEDDISIFNLLLDKFKNYGQKLIVPYTQLNDTTIQVLETRLYGGGFNYYYNLRNNIGLIKLELTDMPTSWMTMVKYDLMEYQFN